MSLSAEISLLYKIFKSNLVAAFSEEKEFIEMSLRDDSISRNLELRLRYVELIAIIKFINDLPIFVPEVEKTILEGIKAEAEKNHLNVELTTSFFKVVMEHSKAVQARLIELLKIDPAQSKQQLSEKISSLKGNVPGKSVALVILEDTVVTAQDKLKACRTLVQEATHGVLQAMVDISNKAKNQRRLSRLGRETKESKEGGRALYGLFPSTSIRGVGHSQVLVSAQPLRQVNIPSKL